jgi:hypothetical protein
VSRSRRNLWVDLIFLALLYVWIAAYSYPYFFHSLANNYQELITYDLDSAFILQAVKSALSSPWFRMRFSGYGHFYFNLVIATSYLYSLFLPLSDRVLFFILRLYSLIGGYFSIAVVFVFARRYLGRMEAIFAAAIMAFSPAFVEYFTEAKPDTWQIFLVTLSLYYLARAVEGSDRQPKANFNSAMAAAAAAGAAFGTKYLGILLIPLLCVAGWMVSPGDFSDRFFARITKWMAGFAGILVIPFALLGYEAQPPHVMSFFLVQPQHIQSYLTTASGAWSKPYWIIQGFRLACLLASLICSAIAAAYLSGFEFARYRNAVLRVFVFISLGSAFIATFALTSPWLIWRLQFLPELYFRNDIEGSGDRAGFQWLSVLFGYSGNPTSNYVSHGVGALAIFGGLALFAALFRRHARDTYLQFQFVLGFAVIFITLLVVRIHNIIVPHAFPILPAFLLLAAFGLYEARQILSRLCGQRLAAAAAIGIAALLIATQIWQGAAILLSYKELVVSLAPDNRMLGEWFDRCVPVDTRILASSGSYVPPNYTNSVAGEGYKTFAEIHPDIMIVKITDIADRGQLVEKEKRYSRWDYDAADIIRFYDILHSGEWNAGETFGPFQVYVKTGAGLNAVCR